MYYVTIIDGGRVSYALGPFHWDVEALRMVDAVDRYVQKHYEAQGAWFWSFGTCKLVLPEGREYPQGKLNDVFVF